VLCLDEVELGDIADAAIVSRLFDSALCSGARIVATSNSAPADLYPGGLNRHVYVPALCKTLERHAVAIHALPPNSKDYRSRPRLKGGSGNKESGGSLNSGFVGRNSSIVHGGGSAVKCNDGGAEGSGGESWGGPAEVAAGGVSDSSTRDEDIGDGPHGACMGNNGGSLHAERSLSCVSSNREDRDRAVDGDSERRAAETAAPEQRWYFPADEAALDKLQQGVRYFGGSPPLAETLHMGSRPLRIPFASGGACLFTFRQLCSANLASADYLKLASRFHTLAIHDVPAISDASRDEVDLGPGFVKLLVHGAAFAPVLRLSFFLVSSSQRVARRFVFRKKSKERFKRNASAR